MESCSCCSPEIYFELYQLGKPAANLIGCLPASFNQNWELHKYCCNDVDMKQTHFKCKANTPDSKYIEQLFRM